MKVHLALSSSIPIISGVHQAVFHLDRDLFYVAASKEYLDLAGLTGLPFGRRLFALDRDDDGAQFSQAFAEALLKSETRTTEEYCARSRRWFEYRVTPISSGASVLVLEVTKRKEADLSRQRANFRDRSILDGSALAIGEVALDGRWLSANQRCREITGYSEDYLRTLRLSDLSSPRQTEVDHRSFADLISGKVDRVDSERQLLRSDGSESCVGLALSLLRSPGGRPQSFVVVFDGIAQRKKVEESLQFALEAAQMGDWDYDAVHDVTRRSGRFNRVMGYLAEPLPVWGYEEFVRHTHPDDRSLLEAHFRRAPGDGENYIVILRIVWPDQSLHWISLRGRVYLDSEGLAFRMAGVVMDVTREKEHELELQNARLAAEDANREKSYFLANMSHEIRTPLSAILGFSEALRDAELSSAEQGHYLQIINRNGLALGKLIDDILDLSKVEAGYLEVDAAPISVLEMVNEIESLLSAKAHAKGISLKVEVTGPVPAKVVTDPIRLRQILINVIGNAIKFTNFGTVTVRIGFEEFGRYLTIGVSDTGVGISSVQEARLFQPFMQADSSTTRTHGGTGLGLALSRRLARAMGGDLTLQGSVFGKGSTFLLRLPGLAAVISEPPADDTCPGNPASMTLDGLKILLAEDSPDNQELIRRLLQKRGAAADFAVNGEEAVGKALGADYDLVLMDMQMPKLDGYEATRQLRRAGFNRPIIALTANAMRHDREKCLAAGCTDYLSKPIDALKLYRLIGQVKSRVMERTQH